MDVRMVEVDGYIFFQVHQPTLISQAEPLPERCVRGAES
jgi:hypothetical protein